MYYLFSSAEDLASKALFFLNDYGNMMIMGT